MHYLHKIHVWTKTLSINMHTMQTHTWPGKGQWASPLTLHIPEGMVRSTRWWFRICQIQYTVGFYPETRPSGDHCCQFPAQIISYNWTFDWFMTKCMRHYQNLHWNPIQTIYSLSIPVKILRKKLKKGKKKKAAPTVNDQHDGMCETYTSNARERPILKSIHY